MKLKDKEVRWKDVITRGLDIVKIKGGWKEVTSNSNWKGK